ncbi:type II toxin-antitoxin system VapC family toxin [Dyadobacter luticola]|uniref:PIN domain-containing protein n=1 Tax=Dyadobacter luticola TaxID=1979387 RepID=A0A5R9L3E5_9BACT|nr:PIN domain-containing protein [Dyadobacter luticola]TLV03086.1 PIN domain-containing protein [Dyadobacter luticola]
MKLFLDTNVLLDHALDRPTGQPNEVRFLLTWAEENSIAIYMSAGSIYAFTYLMQRNGIRDEALKGMLHLYLRILRISPSDTDCFLDAVQSGFKDMEDAFQHQTALRSQCDYLLTNNVKDFKLSTSKSMKILTPNDFLTNVLKKRKGIHY